MRVSSTALEQRLKTGIYHVEGPVTKFIDHNTDYYIATNCGPVQVNRHTLEKSLGIKINVPYGTMIIVNPEGSDPEYEFRSNLFKGIMKLNSWIISHIRDGYKAITEIDSKKE
jgi:hypothetical protein